MWKTGGFLLKNVCLLSEFQWINGNYVQDDLGHLSSLQAISLISLGLVFTGLVRTMAPRHICLLPPGLLVRWP